MTYQSIFKAENAAAFDIGDDFPFSANICGASEELQGLTRMLHQWDANGSTQVDECDIWPATGPCPELPGFFLLDTNLSIRTSKQAMRRSRESEHAAEAEFFLRQETEENIARGMLPDEARRAAILKYGNSTALREEVYQMRRIRLLDTVGRDLHYAARVLKGAPTFSLVSLTTLALGIGATTAIFTVVNGVILQPLPFRDPSRLVTIWETNPSYNLPGRPPGTISFSPGNYRETATV